MAIIHETIIKDIIDIIDDVKDLADSGSKSFNGNEKKFTSLTKNANDLILVFPALCTRGISVETASMLSKAIEKNCASLLTLLFASMQISRYADLQDYIGNFHSNISNGNKITVDDFITITDRFTESGDITIDKDIYNKFKTEIHNVAKTALNEYSLSNFKCHKTVNGIETILEDDDNPRPGVKAADIHNDSKFIEYLTNNDIKKANELMPTKVLVNFNAKSGPDGEVVGIRNAVIGVKCKLYPVDSLEIIQRVSTKYADTNWVRELVRASTGEISFWRDFVFALDRARIDAINSAKKGSSATMFKVLERRATKNRLSKWKANRADCAPITTLIINQDEVEYLKKDYDINIENRNIAIKLMEAYNLMGLTIVDEPAESASFIWDEGNNANFETLSFRSLERESGDSNYKKVINLMTKISR